MVSREEVKAMIDARNELLKTKKDKINEALKPFGATFEELFMARHSEITSIGFEIQRKEDSARYAGFDEAKGIYQEIRGLKQKQEILIYGRLVEGG